MSQHQQQSLAIIARKVRTWPELPHDTVLLPSAPTVQAPMGATMLVTSLLSMGGVVVSTVLLAKFGGGSGQGTFFLAFLAMSVFATLASLISYVLQMRNARRQQKYLMQLYAQQLADCKKKLQLLQQQERQARVQLNPPLVMTNAIQAEQNLSVMPILQRPLNEQDMELWARRADDPDFLTVRIGLGKCNATYTIHGEDNKSITMPTVFDELKQQAYQMREAYSSLIAPIALNLTEQGPVALACSTQRLARARELLHAMVAQVAYHHSPEDVRIIVLAPQSQEAQWQWAALLPHTLMIDAGQAQSDEQQQVRTRMVAIGPEAIVEQLPIISRELSRRELLLGDERRSSTGSSPVTILPRLVIVVDHFAAIDDLDPAPSSMPVMVWQAAPVKTTRPLLTASPLKRAEMTLALTLGTRLGVSVISVCASPGDIPTTCRTMIDMRDQIATSVGVYAKAYVHTLRPDPPPSVVCDMPDDAPLDALRNMASRMQMLRPAITKRPQIRTQVDARMLFEPILDLENYDPINIWSNTAYRTLPSGGSAQLRVPIGMRMGDELQYLDLVRDGPHGLLIGQTGSGKSELLQTIITTLATIYRPSEVIFLLIDYKAGLALEPFRRLPHTVGFLSNVSSPALIQRFITMLRAEALEREKRLKKGLASPRLVIIIDEFAEMAKRTETVLDELFTITRVGRELGMHLLLAAQRPEGIIGSKVRDYVQYRLCLRCASPDDSREVLGRTDAASLPASIPGRGFLLHGDAQLDLFQSARASLPLRVRKNSTNQQMRVTDAKVANAEMRSKPPTVAETIIEHIAALYSREKAQQDGIHFWPDPLPTPSPLSSPDPLVLFKPITSVPALASISIGQSEEVPAQLAIIQQTLREATQQRQQVRKPEASPMRIPLGLADMPDEQKRTILWVDLHGKAGTLEGGPLLLAGGQSSGKGVALQTTLLWLMTQYKPELCRFAIIDAGHDLELFQHTPYAHTEDGASLWTDGESEEQIVALVDRMTQVMTRRREQYPGVRWDEHTLGRLRAQGVEIPVYLIAINNYHSFIDNFKLNDKLKKFALTVTSLRTMGFYLMLTSSELGRFVPIELIGKMGTRIGLFLHDQQRYELFGRNTAVLDPIPGRGYALTRDRVLREVQLALPVPGSSEHQRYETLQQEIAWLCKL